MKTDDKIKNFSRMYGGECKIGDIHSCSPEEVYKGFFDVKEAQQNAVCSSALTYNDILAANELLQQNAVVETPPFIIIPTNTYKTCAYIAKHYKAGTKIVKRIGRGKKYKVIYTTECLYQTPYGLKYQGITLIKSEES